MTPPPISIRPAARREWPDAARWPFAHLPPPVGNRRADHVVSMLLSGELAEDGLLVAVRDGDIVGAMAVQNLPGGSAVVLPPAGDSPAVTDALASFATARFTATGLSLAQAFLDLPEAHRAAPLERHGFRAVTTVSQLSLRPAGRVPLTGDVRFRPYETVDPGVFADTLMATYTDSDDVPEANVGRSATDAVAGYRAGQPDPPTWWLATDQAGSGIGVVLVNANAPNAPEVSYLGVVPGARGRGVGRELVRFAINLAASASGSLALSVDDRNLPALSLYEAEGFRECHRQRVFLWHHPGGLYGSPIR